MKKQSVNFFLHKSLGDESRKQRRPAKKHQNAVTIPLGSYWRDKRFLTLCISALAVVIVILAIVGAKVRADSSQNLRVPAAPAAQLPPQQTYQGMVTDSKCGAKHSALAKNATDCALMCVHSGANFELVDGEAVYVLNGNLEQVKKFAGQRARVSGMLNGNTIKISSIAAGD